MIVAVQLISKILATKDYSVVVDNLLTSEQFAPYTEEFNFIKAHYEKYGDVPDELSFLDKFPEFELQEVSESDEYLISTLLENNLYVRGAEVLQKAAELLNTNANEAIDYLKQELGTNLVSTANISDVEIVEASSERVDNSEYINQNQSQWFIPTGFKEIDDDINGFQRGNELVVIFARTNQGKSWVLEAMATHIVEQGYKVGYFSPEMSALDIGYRFDTLHGHISNNAIRLGRFTDNFQVADYSKYAEETKELRGRMYVTKPKDFARKVTVSKLRNWTEKRNLDILCIDGITYLQDERFKKGDSKTISLTNISEDLMEMSEEIGVPIVVVVQANRGGVIDKNSLDTPELENIRDSDGIAQNASIVYAVKQVVDKDEVTHLIIDNKKMRGGVVGQSYKYKWNIDVGEFEYINNIIMPESDEVRIKKNGDIEVTGGVRKREKKSAEDEF